MPMQLYFPNREVMSRDDIFEVSEGLRNPEGADLFRRLMAAGAYELVAELDISDLGDAYRATQNDNVRRPAPGQLASWGTSPPDGVRPVGEGRLQRSSQMGDILVMDGTMHLLNGSGIVDIGPVPEPSSPCP